MVPVVAVFGLFAALGLGGLAVEYGRGLQFKAAMQAAADAGALATAHSYANGDSRDAAERKGVDVARSNLALNSNRGQTTGVSVVMRGLTTKAMISAKYDSVFAKLVGVQAFPVSVVSQINSRGTNMDVVFVVDNSNSMTPQKMNVVRSVLREFSKTSRRVSADSTGRLRIGLVPFGPFVRVPESDRTAFWLKNNQRSDWRGCVVERDVNFYLTNTPPNRANENTLFPATMSDSNGCRGFSSVVRLQRPDRDDELGSAIEVAEGLAPPGEEDNVDAIDAATKGMSNARGTRIPLGLGWGWHLLTDGFFDGAGYPAIPTPQMERYIVLVSDGANYGSRFGGSVSTLNQRTLHLCQSIKNSGIKIATVFVGPGNQSLLASCASRVPASDGQKQEKILSWALVQRDMEEMSKFMLRGPLHLAK